MNGWTARGGLYLRTVRHLTASQLLHRARLRAQKHTQPRLPSLAAICAPKVGSSPGWPPEFEPVDRGLADGMPSPERNAAGEFELIGRRTQLGLPIDWEPASEPQLWRYHLNYMEWAWSFATHPDRTWARGAFRDLWRSWTSGTRYGRWDAWSPYVVSLRTWVLCGVYAHLVAGAPWAGDYLRQVAEHAGYVRSNLELDVGGNHLVKNLKALIGAGVFFDDARLVHTGLEHLRRQIRIQVLADGGHFERSPSYHAQVLGDLVDVATLLAAAGRPEPLVEDAVQAMRGWLGSIVMPNGAVPLLNDCSSVGSARLRRLGPLPTSGARLEALDASGYYVLRPGGGFHVVFDAGLPCPRELPAHAHADCLSFVLAVDGTEIVVDTGTSTYEPGAARSYERSTRAHNTLEIDGIDQTEVWGAFRAGRRATPTVLRAEDGDHAVVLSAEHDGYRHLPGRPVHRRTIRAHAGGLDIEDRVEGSGEHDIAVYLHFAPGIQAESTPSGCAAGPIAVEVDAPCASTQLLDPTGSPYWVALSFGQRWEAHVLVTRMRSTLPVSIRSRVARRGQGSAAAASL